MTLAFLIRRVVATVTPSLHYSNCKRCKLPWYLVHGHAIMYDRGRGCFPICDQCWDELKPTDRVRYYLDFLRATDERAVADGYEAERYDTPERRARLEANVLANKQDDWREMLAGLETN